MDTKLAQKIIDEEIGSDYTIYKVEDSEKYTFAYYKHKYYEDDDERGHLVGVGPVAFNKETKEYKLLSSGDILCGDYFDFQKNIQQDSQEPEFPDFDEIKKGILRRKYVNSDDIFYLGIHWDKQFEDKSDVHLTFNKEIDFKQFLIASSSNKDFLSFMEEYWRDLNLDSQKKDDNHIILRRIF